ncbi:peptidase domain-containing ABC transporter [Massilia aquatica]|uniref:Peptidase domain-containing ABC transporter n=1 Tax=Massilia aquatica TaxID=2609000 RepID=A0ABX0LZX7_9BURK|nr:peptidase domain-containing ABC transporter [Massilia aquatica]NHZ40445.1 peptidase domain-containing ABC transporter [Massilia aquatica]
MHFHERLQHAFWPGKSLPILLQTEAAECGLACLGMVASYWGHRVDLANLRRRFSVSLKGATLRSLMTMAQALALQPRPLKLELDQLAQLKLPCILHWDLNHFVVLTSVSATHAVVHDPAVGMRRLPLPECGKHFSGVALELLPSQQFKPHNETQQFSLYSLMGGVTGLKGGLAQILVLGLVLQVCALVAPFYMQWMIDEALLSADRDMITVLGCGFLLLVLLQTAVGAVRSWVTTVLSTNLNVQWLSNAFGHLMKLPLSYFEKRHTGDIVSRFSSIRAIQESLTTQFVEGIIDGFLVLGTLAMMIAYSGKLSALACIAVLIYIAMRCAIFRSLREANAEQIIHAARQQTHFLESVRGVQSIRLFGRHDARHAGWLNTLVDQVNAELRIARMGVSYQSANTFLFNTERVIVIWMAALLVLDNRFSVGMIFAFISYKDQFSNRMASLVDKVFEFAMLRLHGERVADIVLSAPEETTAECEIDPASVSPSVEMRKLSFRYADGEPFILHDLDLTIPAGQCIAVTGPSGCGKTTLMKLLLGLLEPTSGEILIGGVKLGQLGLSNYRRMIGTVMQDDHLFAGSISDNISFFAETRDEERVQGSAQAAALHADIMAMPMGYNTLVGDIGTGLSGGQKQRLLLARALYKTPRLLVLDEATSHLDVWNEVAVNASIRQLNLTRIIVAHRPETIAMAQRVVVLQQGAICQDVVQESAQENVLDEAGKLCA